MVRRLMPDMVSQFLIVANFGGRFSMLSPLQEHMQECGIGFDLRGPTLPAGAAWRTVTLLRHDPGAAIGNRIELRQPDFDDRQAFVLIAEKCAPSPPCLV